MGFVEPISGESIDQIKDFIGLGGINIGMLLRAGHKQGTLFIHFRLDLFPHGPAQQISAAQRIARQDLGHLHDLFLINRNTKGFCQNRFQLWMRIFWCFLTMFTADIGGDILHRPWTIQGHNGDQIFQPIGLQGFQDIAHAGTFQLEHAR